MSICSQSDANPADFLAAALRSWAERGGTVVGPVAPVPLPPARCWPRDAHQRQRVWTSPHTCCQFIIAGELQLCFEDRRGPHEPKLSAGDALIAPAHCWTARRQDTSRRLVNIACLANGLQVAAYRHQVRPADPTAIDDATDAQVRLSYADHPTLQHLAQAITHVDASVREHVVRALAGQTVIALSSATEPTDGHERLRQRARGWMQAHLASGAGRQAAAAALGCSPDHLTRVFRHGGTTYQAALDRIRMEQARTALLNTEDPVADIAAQCGWSSPQQFIAVFKKHHGQTPGAWRRVGGLPAQ